MDALLLRRVVVGCFCFEWGSDRGVYEESEVLLEDVIEEFLVVGVADIAAGGREKELPVSADPGLASISEEGAGVGKPPVVGTAILLTSSLVCLYTENNIL